MNLERTTLNRELRGVLLISRIRESNLILLYPPLLLAVLMLFAYALRPRESKATTRMSSRRPPLFTCGYSFMSIANEVYRKAKLFNGPFGSLAKKINKLASKASPFIYALQCQFLVILLYLDGCILAVEDKVELIFPPSKNVFDKIDEFVHIAQTLPAKLDDGFDRFPSLIHQVPFLEWALVYAISWLNFLVSKLTDWRSGSKEKEIAVDTSCNGNVNESAMESGNHVRMIGSDGLPGGTETRVCPNIAKGSYKDALLEKTTDKTQRNEKGSCDIGKQKTGKDNIKMKEERSKNEGLEGTGKIENKREGMTKHDLILELLESAWLMKPGNKIKGLIPRSASYQL